MENNEKIISEILSYCKEKPGSYEARPFGEYPICFKVMGKIFAQLNPKEDFYKITLKCEPEQAVVYRQLYLGTVVRGYHCPPVQQPYWNTINLDTFEDIPMLWQMIDEAYEAIVHKLTKKEKAPVACGSFKMYDEEQVELKRIYVEPSCNGIGLGGEIVRRLEAKAKMQRYKWCILETGEPLPAACHLYEKLGYKVISNYGQYADMQDSICMGRKI